MTQRLVRWSPIGEQIRQSSRLPFRFGKSMRNVVAQVSPLEIQKIFLIAFVAVSCANVSMGQSTFITTSGTQQWGTAANWTPSGVPSAVGASVIFNSPAGGSQTVNLSPSGTNIRTVGSISITNNTTNTFFLANGTGGGLILDATSGNASITVGGTGNVVNTISATTTLNDTVDISVANTATTSSSGALTLTGAISGAGGLVKTGAGTLSLTTAAKTFTGATSVNEGVLRVSEVSSPASSASMTVASGAQLRLDSNGNRSWNVSSGTVTLNGTGGAANGALRFQGSLSSSESQSFSNAISLATTSSIHTEDADGFINLTGGISGGGGLIKRGSGTLRLDASATYSGDTSVINGTLRLNGADNRLPTGTVVSLGDSGSANLGTLDLNGFNQTIAGLNSTTGTNAAASNNTVTSSTAATLTIGGSGTYSYGDGSAANSGVITGAISLVKSGTGTQTLGDANTYTGTTTVNGGNLVIASTGSHTGGGAYTVNSGGALTVNGTIGSAVNVAAGGTLSGTGTLGALTIDGILAPGNSIGTLNTGTVVWNGAADNLQAWVFELGAGNTSDLLNITGDFTKGTGSVFAFDFGGATNLGTFTLASWTGTTNFLASDFSFLNLGGGNLGAFAFSGSSLQFSVTAIPEPSSLALVGLVGFGLAGWRRRRK